MRSLAMLKPVKSILWSVALLLLGNGLLNTLLTLRGTGEGFSSAISLTTQAFMKRRNACGWWGFLSQQRVNASNEVMLKWGALHHAAAPPLNRLSARRLVCLAGRRCE